MIRLVCICVTILSLLTASLEGAADVAASANPCCGGFVLVIDDTLHAAAASAGDHESEDGCLVCTPLCHCGVHGSALHMSSPLPAPASAADCPAYPSVPHVSIVDPPFLPPPIR